MIEILPNIMSLTGIDKNVPIVLDERFSTEMSEFVTKLSKRDVIRKTKNIDIKANSLFIIPLSSFVIDEPINFNGETNFGIDTALLIKWRELVLNEIEEKEISQKHSKRIFIKRSGSSLVQRGVKNIKAFERVLQKNGFEIIIPQEFSLYDQFKIFNSAHTIIMEEGSACANIIFMKPDTNLILLKSYRAKNFKLFEKLAENFNIRVKKVNSNFDFTNIFYKNFWEATNKLYKVNMRDLKKSIKELESKLI
jgi:ASC-1-like (ASCH) protein